MPFITIILLVLQIRRGIIGNLAQRLGFVPPTSPSPSTSSGPEASRSSRGLEGRRAAPDSKTQTPIIWIHTVSVGETLSVEHFINKIKQNTPGARCYLTVGTIAGKRIAQSHLKNADWISYLPYDFLPCMLLAFHRIRPSALLIAESELWPNFIATAYYKKVPLIWLNARINPYSRTRYLTFKRIFTPLITCFSHIFAQSPYDQQEFENMGISTKQINVLGNIKVFNVLEKKIECTKTHPLDIPLESSPYQIILVGSMHPGEDTLYLSLFTQLKPQFPNLKLIFAPRHFGWQKQLESNVQQSGLSYKVWSKESPLSPQPIPQALNEIFAQNDVLLVCKLGKLFALYPHATIYALGGTFVPIGGHNLLESAVWGVPTIVGPFYQNCKDIADRLEAVDGIVKVHDEYALYDTVKDLLSNPTLAQKIGHNSLVWLERENETVKKQLDILLGMLR